MSAEPAAGTFRAVLLDIEGTTTPIAFVFDVLFPYARAHVADYIERHADDPACRRLVEELRKDWDGERAAGAPVPPWRDASPDEQRASALRYVAWLMDRDRKSTPLKELQGRIWEEGYRRGELHSCVFDDVPRALERWQAAGLQVGIFSSGSVRAQQLLFRHSPAGDLTRFLSWYFDTTTGAKGEASSYRRIAREVRLPAAAIVFASDVVRELDAAREAGLQTRLAVRPGNPEQPAGHGHAPLRSFEEL